MLLLALALSAAATHASAQRVPVNAGDRVRVYRASEPADPTFGTVTEQTGQDLLLRLPQNELLSIPVEDISRLDVKHASGPASGENGAVIGGVTGAAVGLAVHFLIGTAYGKTPADVTGHRTLHQPALTGAILPVITTSLGAAIGLFLGRGHWVHVYPASH